MMKWTAYVLVAWFMLDAGTHAGRFIVPHILRLVYIETIRHYYGPPYRGAVKIRCNPVRRGCEAV